MAFLTLAEAKVAAPLLCTASWVGKRSKSFKPNMQKLFPQSERQEERENQMCKFKGPPSGRGLMSVLNRYMGCVEMVTPRQY